MTMSKLNNLGPCQHIAGLMGKQGISCFALL